MAPAFLGIGAQKAGTTWLYRALEDRPDFWLPPVKELHFFDEKRTEERSWFQNLREDDPRAKRWRRQLATERRRRHHEAAHPQAAERTAWSGRYFFDTPSDDWYRSLFPADLIGGDITPEYALLPESTIADVVATTPDIKVIYLLRNPIEREWSGAVMRHRGTGADLERVLHGGHRRHARYVENLGRWRRHLPAGRLYVGWFDDITARPEELLGDILDFLDAGGDRVAVPSGRPNSGPMSTIPARLATPLARELAPQLEELATQLGGPAVGWAQIGEWLAAGDLPDEVPYPFTPPGGQRAAELSSLRF